MIKAFSNSLKLNNKTVFYTNAIKKAYMCLISTKSWENSQDNRLSE